MKIGFISKDNNDSISLLKTVEECNNEISKTIKLLKNINDSYSEEIFNNYIKVVQKRKKEISMHKERNN